MSAPQAEPRKNKQADECPFLCPFWAFSGTFSSFFLSLFLFAVDGVIVQPQKFFFFSTIVLVFPPPPMCYFWYACVCVQICRETGKMSGFFFQRTISFPFPSFPFPLSLIPFSSVLPSLFPFCKGGAPPLASCPKCITISFLCKGRPLSLFLSQTAGQLPKVYTVPYWPRARMERAGALR